MEFYLRSFTKEGGMGITNLLMSLLATIFLFSSLGFAVQPDPRVTPGALCTAEDPDFDGNAYQEQIPHCNRNFNNSKKMAVARVYNVPPNQWSNYEFDHLIPLCAGGSNDVRNVWPEILSHAQLKDAVEDHVCSGMRSGLMTQKEAIATIFNWMRANGLKLE
jgi:hypothetical protein